MKYSVVIPLYNKQKYIEQTIRSVLNQTYKDYEVIVVDDGSTDDSFNLASQFQTNGVKVVRQCNQGVSSARNQGIGLASGEYIAFLDADDEWKCDYLASIDELVEQFGQSDLFVTAYRIVLSGEKWRYSAKLGDHNGCIEHYWMTYANAYDVVWTSATVVRKSAIVSAGMFDPDETIGEDLDLWARIACNNPKVAYSPRVCVDYNRCAEQNARTREKIAYPKAFLSVLRREIANPVWSDEDKKWMVSKYNQKMTAYVFTSILAGKQRNARRELRNWNKMFHCKTIPFLYIASLLPNGLNRLVYSLRLKVF